jgi:predicted amino acid-binding ACT domain protein
MKTEGSYNPLEKSVAPSHLQIVEITCKDVDGIVLNVLKVLNANGIPLGKIQIQCSGRNLSMVCHNPFVQLSICVTKSSVINNQTKCLILH